ncbi:MAG TPA: hypothetical protein PLU43_12080, partial [Lachnospiraceae bacterium]|nr:hypothetical protein [Lachnospiraceae bacterium]
CAQIMMDKKIQEQTLYKGREEFQQTLDNLTAALKKQQYSYYKLNMITQLLLTQMKEFTYLEMDEHQALYDLVNEIFTTMLKMQTTGAGNIGRFEETVNADLKKIGREHPGFTTGEISSCLIGDILKVKASNIRFVIWMLARYGAAVMKECRLTVSSHFVTATKAMFEITLHGELSEKLPDVVEQMVQELLAAVSMSVKREEREGALVFHIEFLTPFADEAGE